MKITDQTTKPFGEKEIVEYLRERAYISHVETSRAFHEAADEIERLAKAAGKPRESVPIKRGEWFRSNGSLHLFPLQGGPVRMDDGEYLNAWAHPVGIPVDVEIIVRDKD